MHEKPESHRFMPMFCRLLLFPWNIHHHTFTSTTLCAGTFLRTLTSLLRIAYSHEYNLVAYLQKHTAVGKWRCAGFFRAAGVCWAARRRAYSGPMLILLVILRAHTALETDAPLRPPTPTIFHLLILKTFRPASYTSVGLQLPHPFWRRVQSAVISRRVHL